MQKIRFFLLPALILAATAIPAMPAFAWPGVYPLGTTFYNPDRAFNGYTLFSPISDTPREPQGTLYLINMKGEVVHKWTVPFSPILHGRLLPNGNVIIIGQNNQQTPGRPGVGKYWMGGAAGWLVELTWEGELVSRHVDLKMHHDFIRLKNGNTLYLAWERVPKALQAKVRGGLDKSEHKDGTMFNDVLIEINPQGKIVWTWRANDHLDPDIDIIGPIYNRDEWLHGNSIALLDNGNILLTSRSTDAVLIVDRKSGKIVSRIGNAAYLDKKTSQVRQRKTPSTFGGPHDAQQIPAGYLNSGKVIVLDNGTYTHKTRAVVFDPKTGKALGQWPAGGQFGRPLFSYFLGGVQPLPDGRIFICDGANGRFMQGFVSEQNEVAWEFVNPYTPTPQINGLVMKAHVYDQDYCPQFKQLPPARGEPISVNTNTLNPAANSENGNSPASGSQSQASQDQTSKESSGNLVALALAGLAASIVVNVFLWRRTKRAL